MFPLVRPYESERSHRATFRRELFAIRIAPADFGPTLDGMRLVALLVTVCAPALALALNWAGFTGTSNADYEP